MDPSLLRMMIVPLQLRNPGYSMPHPPLPCNFLTNALDFKTVCFLNSPQDTHFECANWLLLRARLKYRYIRYILAYTISESCLNTDGQFGKAKRKERH